MLNKPLFTKDNVTCFFQVSPQDSEQNLDEKYFQNLQKPEQEKFDSIDEQSTQSETAEPKEQINADNTTESEKQKEAKTSELLKSEHKLVRLESKPSNSSSVKLLTSASKKVFDIEEVKSETHDIKSRVTTSSDSKSTLNFVPAASKHNIEEESDTKRLEFNVGTFIPSFFQLFEVLKRYIFFNELKNCVRYGYSNRISFSIMYTISIVNTLH